MVNVPLKALCLHFEPALRAGYFFISFLFLLLSTNLFRRLHTSLPQFLLFCKMNPSIRLLVKQISFCNKKQILHRISAAFKEREQEPICHRE